MPDEDDDHGDNRPEDMKIDDTILKLAEQYVGYENRARALNKDKAAVRAQADKIGIPSLAWQIGVRTVKIMDAKERADFQRGFKRVTGVLSKNAETLFPEDIARQKKRADKAAAKAATEKAKSIERGDTMPRSNPKSGGAGGATGRKPAKSKPTPEELSAAAAAAPGAHEDEQQAGGDVLQEHIDRIKGDAPKSQSAQVAAINEKLGL